MLVNELFEDTYIAVNNCNRFSSFIGFEVSTADERFFVMVNNDGTITVDMNAYHLDGVYGWKFAQRIRTTDEMKQNIYTFTTIKEANAFLKTL